MPYISGIIKDSLGGMKIQPMIVNAGNHFTFPAKVGSNYKVDFYFNLAVVLKLLPIKKILNLISGTKVIEHSNRRERE